MRAATRLQQVRSAMRARLFGACALVTLTAACSGGSTSIDITAPTAAKCEVSVANAMSGAVPAAGASSTLTVTTTRDCTWTATTNATWIAWTSTANGQGSASITYRVSANHDPAQRRATVGVNAAELMVIQDPAPCRYGVTPASTTVSADGASVSAAVDTLTGCSWSATSQVSWIVVASPASGTKSGAIAMNVQANAGAARRGVVTIADQAVTVDQAAHPAPTPTPTPTPTPSPTPTPPPTPSPSCAFTIGAAGANVPAGESEGSVAVTTGSGCTWTAISNAPWITIKSGASGTGNDTVVYHVAANAGAPRSGTVTIADKTYTIAQAAATCAFAISAAGDNVGAGDSDGSVAVTVTAGAGCTLTATSNVPWITIKTGAAGSGNGTVTYHVAANTGAARSAALAIADKIYTITQAAAPCAFAIDPPAASVTADAVTATVAVTTTAACAWTASSPVSWARITAGASGTGSGTVTIAVAANTVAAARAATLTIAGQGFNLSQAAGAPPPPPPPPPACTFTIAPTSAAVAGAGGPGSVAVTASASDCTWIATSGVNWIVTGDNGASHTGSGSLPYTVSPNSGPARNGTVTIAGQTFTVNQGAP